MYTLVHEQRSDDTNAADGYFSITPKTLTKDKLSMQLLVPILFVTLSYLSNNPIAFGGQDGNNEVAKTEPIVPTDAPGSQSLVVDREEFEFSLKNGSLRVKHYAKDAIGFAQLLKDPSPLRNLEQFPNFVVIAVESPIDRIDVLMLDTVSLTLSDTVSYTLGKNIEAVQILLKDSNGVGEGAFHSISLRDANPDFTGVRPARFAKFRKIPLTIQGKVANIPLLPADSIRSLLFSRGQDVRSYYLDLNDANQDLDGYFLFHLEGTKLKLSHFGARKLNFHTSNDLYEPTEPPHPFKFSVVSGDESFHLDPADFNERDSAVFVLPKVYETLEIWSGDPNTLTSIFQAKPSLLRNSLLKGADSFVPYRASELPKNNPEQKNQALFSQRQLLASDYSSIRYMSHVHSPGLKVYGEFIFDLVAEQKIVVTHRQFDAANFGLRSFGNGAVINPDFSFRFALRVNDNQTVIELERSDFENGQAQLLLDTELGDRKMKRLEILTDNLGGDHAVFFENLVLLLTRNGIRCESVFSKH